MKTYQNLLLILCFLFLHIIAIPQNSTSTNPTKSILSEQEQILYNLINDLRQEHKLPVLPVSEKLCIVGKTHINDLENNYKQDEGCSLHSWSNKGKWTPCCHSKDPSGIACMKTKPKEITGYTGFGFELIYWGNEKANALDAYNLWRDNKASLEMILCNGKWKSFKWKTMGVAISSNYAILWFGDIVEKSDILPEKQVIVNKIVPAESTKELKNQDESTEVAEKTKTKTEAVADSKNNYFLIVASLKSKEAAKTTLKKYKSSGYPKAQIIDGGSMQRIAIKGFVKESDAQAELNKLREKHPGIWILHK